MDLFMDDRIDEESDAEFAAEKPESLYDTELLSLISRSLPDLARTARRALRVR